MDANTPPLLSRRCRLALMVLGPAALVGLDRLGVVSLSTVAAVTLATACALLYAAAAAQPILSASVDAPATSIAPTDDVQSWLARRRTRGLTDAPVHRLAREASRELHRWVGLEELAAAIEGLDAQRAVRRAVTR